MDMRVVTINLAHNRQQDKNRPGHKEFGERHGSLTRAYFCASSSRPARNGSQVGVRRPRPMGRSHALRPLRNSGAQTGVPTVSWVVSTGPRRCLNIREEAEKHRPQGLCKTPGSTHLTFAQNCINLGRALVRSNRVLNVESANSQVWVMLTVGARTKWAFPRYFTVVLL